METVTESEYFNNNGSINDRERKSDSGVKISNKSNGIQLKQWELVGRIHSSTLAWKIPWTEEPGRLEPMGSRRVAHD